MLLDVRSLCEQLERLPQRLTHSDWPKVVIDIYVEPAIFLS